MPIPTDPLILNSQDRRHRDQDFAVARFTRRLWFSSPLILMLAEGLSISVVSFRKGCRPWLLPSYLEARSGGIEGQQSPIAVPFGGALPGRRSASS